jgi:uncharacterized protein (TIGR03437 family)
MKAAVLLGVIGALQSLAQPVCPPVNFQQLAQVKLQNRPQKILSGMLRQADQSFSQYEITGSVQGKTASQVGIVPNIQQSFFTCSGLAVRKPGTGPAPNRSKDPLGTASQNTIITDLAGDGVGAIVGLDRRGAPGQVVVATANPDFSLRSAAGYPVGANPQAVVAGDFNGDGKHDVAVVYFGPLNNSAPGGVSLLLGNGDGTLQPAVNYPAGLGAIAAAAWDFNGDGKGDLAVLNNQDSTVTIMFGGATGKLTMGNTYSTGLGSFPTGIAVADINGDGIPDLLASGFNGIGTLLGNGDGTFRTGPFAAFPTAQSFLATGDFNKDGKVDVAVTDYYSGLIFILLGNGDGTFKQVAQYVVGYAPGTFYVEDFDRDGNPDIVFAQGHPDALITLPYTQIVGVLFGNGDGTFAGAPAYLVPGGTTSIVAADFNGDGKPDLAVGGQGPISILLGSGGGRFQAAATLNGGGGTYTGLAAGDLNGDGKMDLAINDSGSGAVVYLGNGDGTFQTPRTVAGGGNGTSFVAIGDFNNDHKLDLAIANHDSNSVTITPGNGNGTFGAGATFAVGSKPTFLVSGDFNRDGNLDLAVVNSGSVFMPNDPGSLSILLGKGDGTFQKAVNYTAPVDLWPSGISAGDFNKDGIADLLMTTYTSGTGGPQDTGSALVVFIGNSDGTFKPGVLIPTEFGPEPAAVFDFNGDGKLDLVVPHCCGDTDITYALGNGDGTFQKEVPIRYNNGAYLAAMADFNGDGKPDLAFVTPSVTPYDSSVFIFLSLPSTVTQPVATLVSAANPAAVGVAPDSLATAYGTDLATSVAGGTSLPWPLTFGGTSISILDSSGATSPAPLTYVSPTQVNFEVPPGVATGAAQVTVTSGDGTKSPGAVLIVPVAPGLYELNGGGLAAAYVIVYHADGSQTVELVYTVNSAGAIVASPVSLGSSTDQTYLFLFGTGLQAAGTGGVKVSIGGSNAPVQYAGAQGGFPALDQVNVMLPASLAGKGNVAIQLTANGLAANTVNITVH